MAQLPILPLKIDALIGDTTHMTAEEFGAYCRILFTMWRHQARLVDDPNELARIAGVSRRRWASIAERVLRPTFAAGGIRSQKRLTDTWNDVKALRKKRAEAAVSRWGKPKYATKMNNGTQNEVSCSAVEDISAAKLLELLQPHYANGMQVQCNPNKKEEREDSLLPVTAREASPEPVAKQAAFEKKPAVKSIATPQLEANLAKKLNGGHRA